MTSQPFDYGDGNDLNVLIDMQINLIDLINTQIILSVRKLFLIEIICK
jgi:hypothetical protein